MGIKETLWGKGGQYAKQVEVIDNTLALPPLDHLGLVVRWLRDMPVGQTDRWIIKSINALTQDGQLGLNSQGRRLIHLMAVAHTTEETKNFLWHAPQGTVMDQQLFNGLLDSAYDYLSTPILKMVIADIFDKFRHVAECDDQVELYRLHLDNLLNNIPVFDPETMNRVGVERPYIGGIPLYDQDGVYVFSYGYRGAVEAKSGRVFEVANNGLAVEIKRRGRAGQQTNEPGYFKVKEQDKYAEGIVVTKVPGEGGARDPDLYFRKLFRHVLDNYPFAMGPVFAFKGEWRSGDNFDTNERELLRMHKIMKEGRGRAGNVEAAIRYLVEKESRGTPLAAVPAEETLKEAEAEIEEVIQMKRKWRDPKYCPDKSEVGEMIIQNIIEKIAAWKTNNGQVLYRDLGFNQVAVGSAYPFFYRPMAEVLRRKRKLCRTKSLLTI